MASSSIACISSALDDLQLLTRPSVNLADNVTPWLIDLRTFLLCARKWCKDGVHLPSGDEKSNLDNRDASLEALVARIEDTISKRAQVIRSIRLTSMENKSARWELLRDLMRDSRKDIKSFRHQLVYEWYVFFSDCSSKQSSNLLVGKDDILEFMDSLLETLVYFHWRRVADEHTFQHTRVYKIDVTEAVKALKEKLAFLKNFIRFVTLYGVEDAQLGPLLTHSKVVAIEAARLSYECLYMCEVKVSGWSNVPEEVVVPEEIYTSISELVLKIFHLEPQVHETCVQALIASKLSRQLLRDTDQPILKNFVDSLVRNNQEILKFGGDILYLSLNAIKDGILLSKDMDLESSDLLKKVELLETILAQKCPKLSLFDFPKTNGLGFIDFLLDNIMDLKSTEAGSIAFMKHPIQTVHEELVFLHSFLEKIVEFRDEDEELQTIWNRVVQVAYKVEFLVDSLTIGDVPESMSFHSIIEEIKIIKAEALKISDGERLHSKVKEASKRLNDRPTHGSKPIINDVVVGLEDEAKQIINRLTGGSKQVQIISIVGMPGLGKTTLAKKVYNHPSVKSHFHELAWCTISQLYHVRNLLLQILTCIEPNLPEEVFKMSEELLAHRVKQRLLRNRYLIVLDDIWDIEAWNRMKASFPDDVNGSRFILTSRLRDVASQDKLDQEPYSLRQLTPDESWDLLKAKLYPGKDFSPLEDLRQQVVEMCQGLPLTIVILAGILSSMDPDAWKEVVEGLSLRNVSSTEQCTAILELSYKHLPDNLKACFLYFGAFPEDYEHNTRRLISLWVAEGFAQKTQLKRSVDVAKDYLMELIGKSLVLVSKPRSIDGVKACRIHDLLYEFCVGKAKEEKFLHLVPRHDDLSAFNAPRYLRRVCIDSKSKHFDNSRLYSRATRSLLLFNHDADDEGSLDLRFIFHIIKLVRVLDLSQIDLEFSFPEELELLLHLRYLAIRRSGNRFPASICRLENLETLIWRNSLHCSVSLPDAIWNLKKLRHLQLVDEDYKDYLFFFPNNYLDNSSQLYDLDFLSTISLDLRKGVGNINKLLEKFPNIRKLRIDLCLREGGEYNLALNCLSQLESLSLSSEPDYRGPYQLDFQYPLTIKKLTLSYLRLPWSKLSTIGNLPNLEVLKLLEEAFMGEIWEMEAEEFPELRFLKLDSLDIVNWKASEDGDYFPRLQKFLLQNCGDLKEIPSCLGNSPALEIIEASKCPYCTSLLEQIREEQRDMGNTDLKILIS